MNRHRSTGRARALTVASMLLGSPFAAASADELVISSPFEQAGGWFGYAVSGVPDLNGDGHDDLIVGASREDVSFPNAGTIYIISGATGAAIRVDASPNQVENGHYGNSVSGIPDIDGDGRGDYIVGAPGESGGGRAYVYSGATGNLIRSHVSGNPVPGGRYGHAVAGIDDRNGDGRGDYLIGAPHENGGGQPGSGRVYVVSGATGTIATTRISPNPELDGRFGWSLDAVPDADDDGRGDWVVGAPREDPGGSPPDSGRAYLYSGFTNLLSFTFASPNPEPFGGFGYAVAGVPNVGAGGGEVLIGAPFEDVLVPGLDLFPDAGRAYLYSGTVGILARTYREVDANISDDGEFGYDLDGIADVDGDGGGDVIIGAPSWPGYHAYVVSGANSDDVISTISSPDDLGANQRWGSAVAGIRDVNGDGRGDWAVGGYGADAFPEGPSQSGRVLLSRFLRNDGCGPAWARPSMSDGENPFSTIGATPGGVLGGCLEFIASSGDDVWFTWTATCTGTARFSTCHPDTTFDTRIAIYAGCGPLCALDAPLGCNNDAPIGQGCTDGHSSREIEVNEGQCYRIRISGVGGSTGTGVMTISCSRCGNADIDGNGTVDGADLAALLAGWGQPGSTDLTGDLTTDGADLAALLAAWGDC